MALRFYNTLSQQVEEFRLQEGNLVRMYTCGPTVYNFAHIGNFRTFVFYDLLRRWLAARGYKLDHVMNITDVEDRIIRNSIEQHKAIKEYTAVYEKAFFEDCEVLRLTQPERWVRATEHISEMAAAIAKLGEKGYTYTSEGSVYFRIASFPDYGKLSHNDFSGIRAGARVDVDTYEKADARDFVLWKSPKDGEPFWDTPIGPGRPGWHIECSVMAIEYLGETLDIHAGGVDLIFPHHENEIAQSVSLTGKPFARYWLHSEFLLVDGQKMSKSLGNFYTLRDVLERGYPPETVRYLLASVPYRNQLNFTFDGLKQAAVSVDRLRNFQARLAAGQFPAGATQAMAELAHETSERMTAGMQDDLNTAQAQAAIFDMVRKANAAIDAGQFRKDDAAPLLAALRQFDDLFDVLKDDDATKVASIVAWAKAEGRESEISRELLEIVGAAQLSDEEIGKKIAEMEAARRARNFKASDAIRSELTAAGIIVEITKDGPRWKRK